MEVLAEQRRRRQTSRLPRPTPAPTSICVPRVCYDCTGAGNQRAEACRGSRGRGGPRTAPGPAQLDSIWPKSVSCEALQSPPRVSLSGGLGSCRASVWLVSWDPPLQSKKTLGGWEHQL